MIKKEFTSLRLKRKLLMFRSPRPSNSFLWGEPISLVTHKILKDCFVLCLLMTAASILFSLFFVPTQVAQLPIYQITQLPNYPITQSVSQLSGTR